MALLTIYWTLSDVRLTAKMGQTEPTHRCCRCNKGSHSSEQPGPALYPASDESQLFPQHRFNGERHRAALRRSPEPASSSELNTTSKCAGCSLAKEKTGACYPRSLFIAVAPHITCRTALPRAAVPDVTDLSRTRSWRATSLRLPSAYVDPAHEPHFLVLR